MLMMVIFLTFSFFVRVSVRVNRRARKSFKMIYQFRVRSTSSEPDRYKSKIGIQDATWQTELDGNILELRGFQAGRQYNIL